MTDSTMLAALSRKARRFMRSRRRAWRSGWVSSSVPNPLSSGCEKLSSVLASRSRSPASGLRQERRNVPPVGTRMLGPMETSAVSSPGLAAFVPTLRLTTGS